VPGHRLRCLRFSRHVAAFFRLQLSGSRCSASVCSSDVRACATLSHRWQSRLTRSNSGSASPSSTRSGRCAAASAARAHSSGCCLLACSAERGLCAGWRARRAQKGRDAEGLYKGADALAIDSGANNEDELYCKSKALQTWLLGYEFTETVILVCSRSIHVLASKKKIMHLEPLKTAENATLPLELLRREKTDADKANYAALVSALQSSHGGKTVATLNKEKPQGEFAAGWRGALDGSGLALVELAPALAELLSTKDQTEVACRGSHSALPPNCMRCPVASDRVALCAVQVSCTKRAAIFSSQMIVKHLTPRVEGVVDGPRPMDRTGDT
jgi:hypothetical protein